ADPPLVHVHGPERRQERAVLLRQPAAVVRHHGVGRVPAQAALVRQSASDGGLARAAPAADPVDVPQPLPVSHEPAGRSWTRVSRNDCMVRVDSWFPTSSTVIVTESPGWASTRAGPTEATVPTYTWSRSPASVMYQYFCPPVMSQPACAIVPV